MKATPNSPAAQVLGVQVDAVDMTQALAHIAKALHRKVRGYICVAGVHGVMEASRSPLLSEIYAESEMTIPDGMPLVWVGRLQGHDAMRRVTGPDLMLEVFGRKEFANVTHYLYGGVEGVAEQLRSNLIQRFPWVRIVGASTPPFAPLTLSEESELVATIAQLKPDIIWVGLGCPKQEIFMAQYASVLDTKLMFGVGAAFDYHTGRILDCSNWIKQIGMQWLHRLIQDPRRLWRRYLRNNPAFLWQIALQFAGYRKLLPMIPPSCTAAAKKSRAH